jgi:CheY-specific phosphatase CheX
MMDFPEATAAALARRVLAEAAVELSTEMIRDCMGEVANVVAGQAKALLFGTPFHFTLSTPTVLAGHAPVAGGSQVVVFDSDVGEFAARISPA